MSIVLGTLLGVVGLSAVVAVWGVLVARDAFDALHLLGVPALVGGTALIAVALLEHGFGSVAARTTAVVLLLQLGAVVTTHATARAAAARGDLARSRPDAGRTPSR